MLSGAVQERGSPLHARKLVAKETAWAARDVHGSSLGDKPEDHGMHVRD